MTKYDVILLTSAFMLFRLSGMYIDIASVLICDISAYTSNIVIKTPMYYVVLFFTCRISNCKS